LGAAVAMTTVPDVSARSRWRLRWLAAIREVADIGLQRSTWLNAGDPNQHFTFVEFACGYFDDLGLRHGYGEALALRFLSAEEAAAVASLHAVFDAYASPAGDDSDHEAILADPHWLAVVIEAEVARSRLAAILQTPAEASALTDRSPFSLAASKPAGRG
jgi:hypothetical protein